MRDRKRLDDSIRIRLGADVRERLERLASKESSYPSTIARRVLTDYVREQAAMADFKEVAE